MAERIQLKEPGSEFVMNVLKVSSETIEGIEYFLFANGQKELLVPKSSVGSQLERLGAEIITDVVGKTVKFSRSTKLSKYGKAFWNLDLASGAENGSAGGGGNAGNPASAPPVEPPKKRNLGELYLMSAKYILTNVIPLYEEKQIGVSDQAVAAMTATLFIAASKEWTGEKP